MNAPPLVAGVELGGTKCVVVLGTGPEDLRARVQLPTTTPEATLGAIEAVLAGWSGVAALGIASFGPISIDPARRDWGHVTATTKPGWSGVDVAGRLRRRTGVPVAFHTDVVGAALAEGCWGAAKGLADHAYITIGTGVGVGLVLHGRPVAGLTHPELGHLRPVRAVGDDWPGTCPFHGDCVEGLASGPAIAARSSRAPDAIPADDPIWELIAHPLAQLIAMLALTGIPRRVVVGGGVGLGAPDLLPRIRRVLAASLSGYGDTTLIEPLDEYVVSAALGGDAGPLGALLLAQRALETFTPA